MILRDMRVHSRGMIPRVESDIRTQKFILSTLSCYLIWPKSSITVVSVILSVQIKIWETLLSIPEFTIHRNTRLHVFHPHVFIWKFQAKEIDNPPVPSPFVKSPLLQTSWGLCGKTLNLCTVTALWIWKEILRGFQSSVYKQLHDNGALPSAFQSKCPRKLLGCTEFSSKKKKKKTTTAPKTSDCPLWNQKLQLSHPYPLVNIETKTTGVLFPQLEVFLKDND